MNFEDRISQGDPLPDLTPMKARYATLCAHLIAAVIHPEAALSISQELRRHVRLMIQASQQIFRRRQKLEMLLRPLWRERVIADLGGWRRLKQWTKRQAKVANASNDAFYTRPFYPVTPEEARRRADMREVMKANAHPLILRDPCRMDFEGQFRLPPLPKLSQPRYDHPLYCDYEYDCDPRPKSDFTGMKAPIIVWPEEFKAAAEIKPFVEDKAKDEDLGSAAIYADTTLDEEDAPDTKLVRSVYHARFHLIRQQLRRHKGRHIFVGRPVQHNYVRGPPPALHTFEYAPSPRARGGAL